MQHIHMMIFYPGGVSKGALPDDATDKEIYDIMYTAANIEEGNGNGRIKRREHKHGKSERPEITNGKAAKGHRR